MELRGTLARHKTAEKILDEGEVALLGKGSVRGGGCGNRQGFLAEVSMHGRGENGLGGWYIILVRGGVESNGGRAGNS